jgi:hypothetical protein
MMAQDEDAHARQLEVAKGVPEDVFFEDALIDPTKLDDLLRRAHQLLRMAEDPPRSESLMLETAKDLEREFMQVHLSNAVKFHDVAMVELFQNLAREDNRHLETLDGYYGKKKPPRRSYH